MTLRASSDTPTTMQSKRIEAEQSGELFAADVESTADLQQGAEQTADLLNESIAPATPTTDRHRSKAIGPPARMPQPHAYGFFAFVACAAIAILMEIQEPTGSSPSGTSVTLAGASFVEAATPPQPTGASVDSSKVEQRADSKRKSPGAGDARSVVAFDSRSFATTEKAVSAVFIVRRTQDVRGGAVVQWAARSGSADAGIDFSDASGTVRFADGQRQRAIYVPLRNDLLTEEDETFKVCLRSPRQARISGASCAEATIHDDDSTKQVSVTSQLHATSAAALP